MAKEDKESGEFLTSAENYLFEEFKLILQLKVDADKIYSAWEQWFTATEAVLLIVLIQIYKEPNFMLLSLIVSIFAAFFSIIFFSIQRGNHMYATARSKRLEEIEKILTRSINEKEGHFLRLMAIEHEEREKRSWYTLTTTTWAMRKYIPILFLILWSLSAFYSIIKIVHPLCC